MKSRGRKYETSNISNTKEPIIKLVLDSIFEIDGTKHMEHEENNSITRTGVNSQNRGDKNIIHGTYGTRNI